MSKLHDAVQGMESSLPTLFDRMLSVLGLMRAGHQEIAALHADDADEEVDTAAVNAQVKQVTSLSDQLEAAITEAKGITTGAVQAVQAAAGPAASTEPASGNSPAPATGAAPAASTGAVDPAVPVA